LNTKAVSNAAKKVMKLKINPAINTFWKPLENASTKAANPLELEKSAKATTQLKKVRGKTPTEPLKNLFRNITPKPNPKMKYPEEIDRRKTLGSMSIKNRQKP
jgi:hypothetical protein